MNRIRQIIEEIKELENDPTHKTTLRICSLLENNSKLFLEAIDADDFKLLQSKFEALLDKSPKEYNTADYKSEFEKSYQALAFYLNRIL